MMLFDLHSHSTASDGQHSPSELVAIAKEKGVSVLALTDHDTVLGCEEAEKACIEAKIKFIPGVEITVEGPDDFHIVGLGLDIQNKELISELNKLSEIRKKKAIDICNTLCEMGIDICIDEVMKKVRGTSVGKPHIAEVLVEKGYVKESKDSFDKYFNIPPICNIKKEKLTRERTIQMIHNAGGIAVLAHPYQMELEEDKLHEMISELKNIGLDGIECWYSEYTEDMTQRYIEYAEEFALLKSIGSDFHGENKKPGIQLGTGRNDSLLRLRKISEFDSEILKKLNV